MNQAPATQERILEAAVKLFANQGFNATSTREIARLADVNETSVFRYFPRKQDLFWAAMQSGLGRLRFGKQLENKLASDGDPEQVLPLIVQFAAETSAYQSDLIRLLRFSFLELRPGAERTFREQLGPLFCAITSYLEHCMERGVLRQLDASVAAIGLFSSVLTHRTLHQLLTGDSVPYANTEQVVLAYSQFWLTALLPTNTTMNGRDVEPATAFCLPASRSTIRSADHKLEEA